MGFAYRAGPLFVAGASLLGACASPSPDPSPRPATAIENAPSIPIQVLRPEGAGPFPAIVILHDCSGLGPRSSGSPARWARLLVEQGYVVLIPDSFTTRGHGPGVCTVAYASRNEVSPERRVRDAYEALAYARSLAYVDGARVGLMGGSHGGSTTLATMAASKANAVAQGTPGFAAAVALYPGCARYDASPSGSTRVYEPRAPLLILVGEKDDWTPAAPCRQLAEHSRAAGHPVTVKIYPGAHHAFDSRAPLRYVEARVNSNAPGGHGATTEGNAEAWADSIREVGAFFGRLLKN